MDSLSLIFFKNGVYWVSGHFTSLTFHDLISTHFNLRKYTWVQETLTIKKDPSDFAQVFKYSS